MKAFWIIVALLSLGLGAWVAFPSSESEETTPDGSVPTETIEVAAADDAPAAELPDVSSQVEAEQAPAETPVADAAVTTAVEQDAPVETPAAEIAALPEPAPAAETVVESAGALEAPVPIAEPAQVAEDPAAVVAAIMDSTPTEPLDIPTPAQSPVPAAAGLSIRELPDGTRLVNDRFPIVGEGTKDKPYEVTWDYLTSVRDGYAPRDGKTEIPPHVKMLDGAYVRIGGYLQFPLAAPEPKELLVMLNQWDGCCIGIPPTPYDAIEVSLAVPATHGEKFAAEGAIVGKLKIDPYLVGDWLIGLYLLGDASLDVSAGRSNAEVYGNTPTVPGAIPGG